MESYTITPQKTMLQRFCRLCMREYPFLFPFEAKLEDISIAAMLERILGAFKIRQTPHMPNSVCSHCVRKLEYAFHVQKDFVRNEHRLKHYVKHGELIEKLFEFQNQSTTIRESYADQLLDEHANGLLAERVQMDPTHEVPGMNEAEAEAANLFKTMIPPGGWAVLACDCRTKTETTCQRPAGRKIARPAKRTNRNRLILRQTIAAGNPTGAMVIPISATKCYICSTEMESEASLKDHIAQHVEMLPYSCQECNKEDATEQTLITSLAMLQRHCRMHTYPLKCPHCPQRFRKYTTVYAHVRYRHEMFDNPEGYTCDVCGVTIKYRPTFLFHMRNHRHEQLGTFKCKYCERVFGTRGRLERHVRSHTGERPFACRLCPKTFTYSGQLSTHMSRHNNERGHQCHQCGKAFFNKAMLGQHQATHEPMENRQVSRSTRQRPCPFPDCKHIAHTYQAYYMHRLRHEMAHRCDECERRFARQSELRRHRRIYHTTDHPFKCEPCTKTFLSAQSYREHKDAHDNVRRYACDICDKKFVRRRNLITHRVSHTHNRPYQCDLCESTFKYKSDLNRHKKDKHEQVVQGETEKCVEEIVLLPEDPMIEGILVEGGQHGMLVEEDIELDGTYGEIIETVDESNLLNIVEVVKEEYILQYT